MTRAIPWPFILIITACTIAPTTPEKAGERISLSWENTTAAHPERAAWSDALISAIKGNSQFLYQAKDVLKFCPKFSSLSDDGKAHAFGELFVALSYFESGYNPETRFKEPPPLNVWSEGLLQLTVGEKGLTKDTILKPEPNLRAGVQIMADLVKKYGVIQVAKGKSYWSTLTPGHRNDHIDEVVARVKANAGECE